jgi:hypothetical protein
LLSTLGAAECGELIVRALAFGSYVMLEGRSRGGLALPAILVAAARRHAAPLSEEQRWIALAFAARDDRREEAALQLARFASPPSERCLLALLHGQDFAAACAFEALARRGACDALPQMAALPALARRDPVAVAALATLWPSCSPEQRSATRAQLAGNADLLAVVDRLDRPWPASEARAHGRLRLALCVGLSLSALWLLAALLRGRL